MDQEVHVTGKEMFEYARLDPDRWKILDGCRAYCFGKGFGVIESQEATTDFTIVFGDTERHWWRLWKRDQISVGRDAFADGRVSTVALPELPGNFVRFSPFESFSSAESGSVFGGEHVPRTSGVPGTFLPDTDTATCNCTRPQSSLVAVPKSNCHTDLAHLPRSLAIQAVCREHEVIKLMHFTRACHISSILEHGLLSRTAVTELPPGQRPIVNDVQRIDGQCGSISVSLSYPNYKMFYKYRMLNSNIMWVVLTLSTQILWELDCAFCYRNASTHEMSHIPLAERKTYESLVQMFGDVGDKSRRQLCLLPSYTTDPQAEVLVLEAIPSSMIESVCFSCQQNLDV